MKERDNLFLRHKQYRLIFSPPLLPVASLPPRKGSILPRPKLLLIRNNQHDIYLSNRIFRYHRPKRTPPWTKGCPNRAVGSTITCLLGARRPISAGYGMRRLPRGLGIGHRTLPNLALGSDIQH